MTTSEVRALLPYLTPRERGELDRLLMSPPKWSFIDPHSAQRQIMTHGAANQVLACGRRFGKTHLAIQRLGEAAVYAPDPYAYFAPTYKMLADVWRSFKVALAGRIAVKNEQEKRLELTSGGVIDFWSLDNPDAARGRKYAGVVVDEAAWVNNLGYCWAYVIQPTLIDLSGWAWFLSTPNGRNYFWTLWLMGHNPAYPDWQSWRFPTTANPFFDAATIEKGRALLPERTFQQEYLADFTEDEGAVFRRVLECAEPLIGCAPSQRQIVFGVDWGKSNDFTAIAVMDVESRECLFVEHFNEIGWSLQRGRLMALAAEWQPRAIWAEENSIGSPNIEALQAEGLNVYPFLTTPSSKGPLIESLALAFERGEIAIPNNPVLIGELQAYTMERLPSGRFAYSAPSGMHDDTVIALALAWHGAQRPRARDLVTFVGDSQ